MDSTTERVQPQSRASLAAIVLGIMVFSGALLWWAQYSRSTTVDCGSEFVIEPPDSAEDIECRGDFMQWHFTMPTDEVGAWWAGQSKTPLEVGNGLLNGEYGIVPGLGEPVQDANRTSNRTQLWAYYPEDEGGYIVITPLPDGRTEVTLNG